MTGQGFDQRSYVKRKPLPRDSRHVRTARDDSSHDDALPLVSIDDRPSWSLPPLPDINEIDATYNAHERLDVPEAVQHGWRGTCQQRKHSSAQSNCASQPEQRDEVISSQKNESVSQNVVSREDETQHLPRMWNPIWLYTLILYGFIVLFLALVVGLSILWLFAQRNNGIRTNLTENHYAWTYGPTALLVIIGVAWGQVDFYCRILAPWAHLRCGATTARRTLLLDYVSPALPMTLVAAITNRDWAVLASGIGSLLLKVVIVFSTGLLVLTPTPVTISIPDAVVNSKFVGTNYTVGPIVDSELMRYYGVQERGLDYQYGTSASVAYSTLDLQSLRPNSTVTAMVDGVFPFLDCEVLTPRIVGDNFTWSKDGQYSNGDSLKLTLTSFPEKCPPLASYLSLCMAPDCPFERTVYTDEDWHGPDRYYPLPPLDDLDACANLYHLTVADVTFEKVTGHPSNTSAAWNVNLQQTIGIVCALGYTIDKVNVTINTVNPTSNGGVNTTAPLQRVADVLPGFSYYNLSQDIQNEDTVNGLPTLKDAPSVYGFARLFVILNGGSATTLLNGTTLRNTAEKAFKGVAVQMAHSYLRKADNLTTAASSLYQDQRLQIRQVSLWAMGVGFVLLALCAGAVLLWRSRDAVPRDPVSIGSQATIFAASPTLHKSLEAAASYSATQLKVHLQGLTIASHVQKRNRAPEFSIESAARQEDRKAPMDESGNVAWWRPKSTTVWFMTVALTLPLAVIAALEVLQHESDTNDGLVTMSSTSTIDHSLPSIFASVIMISIAMTYGAIDFVAATLTPYQMLAIGSVPAKQTLLSTSLGNLPIWSTLKAVREHHMKAAVASVATLIGSLLTIIASGLYTIESVPFAWDVAVVTSDRFVPSFGTATDGSAGAIFELIEHNNASYPALTYDGLAFPNIDLSSLGAEVMRQLDDPAQLVTLQASIRATRASLNCTLVPRDIMNIANIDTSDHGTNCLSNQLTFNASLPASCPHFLNGYNETATDIPFTYIVQHTCLDKASMGLYEQVVLNTQGAAGEITFLNTSEESTLGAVTNPPECPSLAFLSGYFVENETSTENMTAMTCIQGLEEVQTKTTFTVSGDTVQIKSEPIIDESSARWLQAFNHTYWFTKVGTFAPFDRDHGTMLLDDYFYDQVNYGPDGIPANELTGPANTQRFVDATQRMYRRYMAQLINATMRQKLSNAGATSAAQHYPGTVSGIMRLRLKQNATSKLILQVFLGIMLACGIFVYSWRRVRYVLPHCPWSIAGTMSLLAGSEMIERNVIPMGAEFMSDKELAKVFEGYMFSLGWWDTHGGGMNNGGKKRRFGIDIGKADLSTKV